MKQSHREPRPRSWTVADGASGGALEIGGLEWGSGEALVLLLHANGFCAATWDDVARGLATHYRVIALDARGHGDSSVPPSPAAYRWHHLVADVDQVVAALLVETGCRSVALCAGSSLGGVIAAALAAERPGVLARVTMLDPPVVPDDETRAMLGLHWPESGPADLVEQARRRRRHWPSRTAAAAGWRDKPIFAGWTERAFQRYLTYGLRDDAQGVTLACAPEVEAAIFQHTASIDLYDRAAGITAPVHIVRASGGRFPPGLYEALAAKMPRGRVSTLTGGHLLPMEVPGAVTELLLQDLRISATTHLADPGR
ncbi:MAG: alpha/beta fold hydrolase [Pseudomonadales bacterium]